MALALACDSIGEFADERTSDITPTPPPAVAATPAGSSATATPTATMAPSAAGLVLPVTIAAVTAGLPEYDRGTWRHWVDEDHDCQNARQEVLIAESEIAVTFESDEQCRVATGSWVGPYTGKTVTSPGDLDIDHLVPLENAHRSGAWSWDRERKQEFANYLGYEGHLIATTSSANRSKGSKGPEAWRPEMRGYWCEYATAWVTVKNQWGLTVTEDEYAALMEMLATCDNPVLLQPESGTPPAPATAVPTPSVGLRYDPFGPDRNCTDFDTYEEALAFFLAAGGPGNDRHRLDTNGDGEPCETLPGGPSARASPEDSDSGTAVYATLPTAAPGASSDCGSASSSNNSDCPVTPTPTATLVPTETPSPTPTPTPQPTPTPLPFEDRDCGDFDHWRQAQDFFLSEGGPDDDPHRLDKDGNGVSCQSLPGAPSSQTESPMPSPSPTPTPLPEAQATKEAQSFVGLPFDPNGIDRDCGDFTSWWDAQNFFFAAGGPDDDPHGLDHNGDGIVCESLDGAPGNDSSAEAGSSDGNGNGFVDRDCGDFGSQQEAQAFFESEGGPDEDPHQLDNDDDGIACESFNGAPSDGSGGDGGFVDRNCGDFDTWREAQDFYLAEGGPAEDPHRLDYDEDGTACESLPGAP